MSYHPPLDWNCAHVFDDYGSDNIIVMCICWMYVTANDYHWSIYRSSILFSSFVTGLFFFPVIASSTLHLLHLNAIHFCSHFIQNEDKKGSSTQRPPALPLSGGSSGDTTPPATPLGRRSVKPPPLPSVPSSGSVTIDADAALSLSAPGTGSSPNIPPSRTLGNGATSNGSPGSSASSHASKVAAVALRRQQSVTFNPRRTGGIATPPPPPPKSLDTSSTPSSSSSSITPTSTTSIATPTGRTGPPPLPGSVKGPPPLPPGFQSSASAPSVHAATTTTATNVSDRLAAPLIGQPLEWQLLTCDWKANENNINSDGVRVFKQAILRVDLPTAPVTTTSSSNTNTANGASTTAPSTSATAGTRWARIELDYNRSTWALYDDDTSSVPAHRGHLIVRLAFG
jgi:hypothetical protein